MFKVTDFDKLNSIWDGTLSNGKEVCGSCKGMCCHNTEKILFPGEYDYLVEKTGQMNSSWKSVGCLCYQLQNINPALGKFKPIICKVFPLDITVPLMGEVILKNDIPASSYTDNCANLIISPTDRIKIQKWLNYLFADTHNRFFYIHSLVMPNLIDDEKEIIKNMGKDPDDFSDTELEQRASFRAFGIPIKDQLTHYDFNLDNKK